MHFYNDDGVEVNEDGTPLSSGKTPTPTTSSIPTAPAIDTVVRGVNKSGLPPVDSLSQEARDRAAAAAADKAALARLNSGSASSDDSSSFDSTSAQTPSVNHLNYWSNYSTAPEAPTGNGLSLPDSFGQAVQRIKPLFGSGFADAYRHVVGLPVAGIASGLAGAQAAWQYDPSYDPHSNRWGAAWDAAKLQFPASYNDAVEDKGLEGVVADPINLIPMPGGIGETLARYLPAASALTKGLLLPTVDRALTGGATNAAITAGANLADGGDRSVAGSALAGGVANAPRGLTTGLVDRSFPGVGYKGGDEADRLAGVASEMRGDVRFPWKKANYNELVNNQQNLVDQSYNTLVDMERRGEFKMPVVLGMHRTPYETRLMNAAASSSNPEVSETGLKALADKAKYEDMDKVMTKKSATKAPAKISDGLLLGLLLGPKYWIAKGMEKVSGDSYTRRTALGGLGKVADKGFLVPGIYGRNLRNPNPDNDDR